MCALLGGCVRCAFGVQKPIELSEDCAIDLNFRLQRPLVGRDVVNWGGLPPPSKDDPITTAFTEFADDAVCWFRASASYQETSQGGVLM